VNNDSEFDPLDSLLAQPPLIADRGFSQRLSREFKKTTPVRSKIFVLSGILWLVLAFTLASPQLLFEDLTSLLTVINISEQFDVFSTGLISIDSTALRTFYPSALAFVLSIAAVFSMLLKD
jgi:hypothetical protein